jgi:Tetratricopeptide repeat
MWGRFYDTMPLLYLAEQMCDAFEGEYQDYDLNDQLTVLRRTIIYERGIRALHTNCPEVSLPNLKKFNGIVVDNYHTIGGTKRALGVSWNELGNAYLQNNDIVEAKKCFLESRATFEAMYSIDIYMPLINLGFAAWLQRRLGEADQIFSQALADREKEYGRNDQTSFVYEPCF